jgi:hypothetical protein
LIRVFYLSAYKMNRLIYVLIVAALSLQACQNKNHDYNPDAWMSKEKQQTFLHNMVRYSSKLAPEATHASKFDPKFNWYYSAAAAECRILFCDLDESDSIYQLLVARKARSVTPMEEGIALKIKLDQRDSISYYEEVFRMWKMPADTLQKRGKFLFTRLVKKEDLTLYYSKFQQDRFIEFPDDRFTFDVEKRKWRDQELDSLKFQ